MLFLLLGIALSSTVGLRPSTPASASLPLVSLGITLSSTVGLRRYVLVDVVRIVGILGTALSSTEQVRWDCDSSLVKSLVSMIIASWNCPEQYDGIATCRTARPPSAP